MAKHLLNNIDHNLRFACDNPFKREPFKQIGHRFEHLCEGAIDYMRSESQQRRHNVIFVHCSECRTYALRCTLTDLITYTEIELYFSAFHFYRIALE